MCQGSGDNRDIIVIKHTFSDSFNLVLMAVCTAPSSPYNNEILCQIL